MRARAIAAGVVLLAVLGGFSGCTVEGPGYYGGAVDVGYVGDYWEPWGYDYGGWGGRYHIGPPPGGRWHGEGDHPGHFGGEGGRPAGHFGGGGRAAPSIPSRPR